MRWYQVRWRATCTHSPTHWSIRWKRSTRITVKATPEAHPVIRQQTLWSPTCTAKQDKMPPTDTHMVDPSIDAPKKNPTNHLYRNVNTTMTQPVKPWSGSKMAQVAQEQSSREKISHLMRFVPFGCVSCILNFHSAGTRCCLCLAGENGHHSKRDWKQVKQRRNTNTTVSQHANRTDSLFRLKSWMILS